MSDVLHISNKIICSHTRKMSFTVTIVVETSYVFIKVMGVRSEASVNKLHVCDYGHLVSDDARFDHFCGHFGFSLCRSFNLPSKCLFLLVQEEHPWPKAELSTRQLQ